MKVPLLLRWPGGERAGATSRRLAGTVDIAPTVLDAAGVAADPAKPPLDGRSLLRSRKRNRVLLEYWREGNRMYPTWASTRTRSFQYVEYYRDDRQTVTFREYYDLRRDPWQLRNLLRDGNPANDPRIAPLAARLAADRGCTGTAAPSACP